MIAYVIAILIGVAVGIVVGKVADWILPVEDDENEENE